MKLEIIVSVVLLLVVGYECAADKDRLCSEIVTDECGSGYPDRQNCSSTYSSIAYNIEALQDFANHHIVQSFDYLMLSARFSSYERNRPGFYKVFRGLSDKAWDNSINLIKHTTKRGQEHDFQSIRKFGKPKAQPQGKVLELNEVESLALVLEMEKELAVEAHDIHQSYSHAQHRKEYDPEVAHYLDEHFIAEQAGTIRKIAGYTNDLRQLIRGAADRSLSVYLFDEYLKEQ